MEAIAQAPAASEAVGIVISQGSRAESAPRFSAYLWAVAPDAEPDSSTKAA